MLKRKIQFKDITKFQWIIELKYIKESERNTLFDSLIKNLDNNKEFKDFIKKIYVKDKEIFIVYA